MATVLGTVVATTQGVAAADPIAVERLDNEPLAQDQPVVDAGIDVLADGLAAPWSVVPVGDGSVVISERDSGRISEITADGAKRDLGVVTEAIAVNETGLLGLALAPHEGTGDRFLYAFTTTALDNRVLRYRLSGDAGNLSLTFDRVVLAGLPRSVSHNGGRIAFGPDGMLYVTTGDATVSPGAQSLLWLGGKILRVTPDGAVPADNPFPGSPVWSLGHRNPQGIAWDAEGRMWASEFGQDRFDELNLIEPGGNYGWPDVEGMSDDPRFRNPVAVWTPAEASPSGIAAVGDTLYMAALRGERLWTIPVGPDATEPTAGLVGEFGRLRDVVAAPDGTLYVLTSNTDGRGEPGPTDDRLLRVSAAA